MSVLVLAHTTQTHRFAIDRLTLVRNVVNAVESASRMKLIIVLPDGRLAINFAPPHKIGVMLDSEPRRPENKSAEPRLTRAIGRLAFGIQVVAIGQTSLLTQMCTVAIVAAASVVFIIRFWRAAAGSYLESAACVSVSSEMYGPAGSISHAGA